MFFIALCTHRPNLEHLRAQLESIRNQTDPNFRCLIHDDASPPEIYDQICALAAHDPRFYTRRNPHYVGVYQNFEAVLHQVAEGAKWICYCDQDDIWLPHKLEHQRSVLENPDVALCHSDLSAIDEQGKVVEPSLFAAEKRNLDDYSVAQMIVQNPVTGCTAAFRRDLIPRLVPFPPQGSRPAFHHDQWTALQAIQAGRIVAIRHPLVLYRRQSGADRSPKGSLDAFVHEWRYRQQLIEAVLERFPSPRPEAGLDVLRYWTKTKLGSLHMLRFVAERYKRMDGLADVGARVLLGKLVMSSRSVRAKVSARAASSRLLAPVRDKEPQVREALRRGVAERTPGLLKTLAPLVWCRYRVVKELQVDPDDRQMCLFAHFDVDGHLEDYVAYQLGELQRAGLDVVLVTTSKLSAQDYARIDPLCAAIIERDNVGIDFGSWRTALLVYPRLMNSRLLVFSNDSSYGPMHPIESILRRMEATDCDFWGITENLEFRSHFQSYFVGFKPSCLRSQVFADFVRTIELLPDKFAVIARYEVAMKGFLEAGGLRGAAMIPAFSPLNPLHHHWRDMLARGVPYLKIELLRDNPLKAPIDDWPKVVSSYGYDPELIERHLRRILPQRRARTT